MFAITFFLTLLNVAIMGIPQLFNIIEKADKNMEFMDEDDTLEGRDRTAYKLLVHYWISFDSYFVRYVPFLQNL